MQSVKKHKWILFFLIGFMIISFFQFLPQTDTLHLEKTSQNLKLAADILPDGGIEQYQTDWLMEPGIAEHQACNVPENIPASAFARTTQSDAVLGEQGQSRFQILRFLVEVYVLIVIPAVILHMALKRFGSHMIMLWQNIKYIHLVDGKKAKHFPVIK